LKIIVPMGFEPCTYMGSRNFYNTFGAKIDRY